MLDARPIVPGSIKKDDLTLSRKLLDVTLKIPLASFGVRRFGESNNPCSPGIEVFGKPLNRSTLTRGIPSFEDQHEAFADFLNPRLHLDEFNLKEFYFLQIVRLFHLPRARIYGALDL